MLVAATVAFVVVLVVVMGLGLLVILADLAPTPGAVSTAGEQAHEEREQAHEERLDQPRDLVDKAA